MDRARTEGHDDRIRDERELRERAARLRADERTLGGHAFRKDVDVGPADTDARARQLLAHPGRDAVHITRWTGDRTLARTVDGLERTREYRAQMRVAEDLLRRGEHPALVRPVVRVPLREAYGPGWRSGVAGHTADARGVRPTRFTDDAEVVAVYAARPGGGWRLHTCYPSPGPPGP